MSWFGWFRRLLLLTVTVAAVVAAPIARAADTPATGADPLATWHRALAAAATERADIAFIGDSITEYSGLVPASEWWTDVVRQELDADWAPGADGRSGYYPAILGIGGTWSGAGARDATDAGLGLRSLVLDTPSASATATVSADAVRLVYAAGPGRSAMHVSIDGDTEIVVDTSAPDTGTQTWDSGPIGPGTHTVQVRAGGGEDLAPSVVLEGLIARRGDADEGVQTWNGAHSGYSTVHFVGERAWETSLALADPDVVVIGLGTNDYRYGVTPADLEANLATMVDRIRGRLGADVSIVLMPMWRSTPFDPAAYGALVEAQRHLAQEQGLGLADLSKLDAAVLTSDGIHPNSAGVRALADGVLRVLNPKHEPFLLRPSDPTAVVATAVSTTSATLRWTAPSGPVSQFAVMVYDITGGTVEARSATASPATVTGLKAGHKVIFGVHAANAAGTSPGAASNTITLPLPVLKVPGNPIGVVASAASATSAKLRWSAATGTVTEYRVFSYDQTGGTVTYRTTKVSPITLTGLKPGHRYIFGVHTANAAGQSSGAASNTLTLSKR